MNRDMRQFLALCALTVLMAFVIVYGDDWMRGVTLGAFLLGWLLARDEPAPRRMGHYLGNLPDKVKPRPKP